MKATTKKGSISAYVLLCMGVLLTASLGVTSLAAGNLTRVKRERATAVAHQAAVAGLEHVMALAWSQVQTANVFTNQTLDISSDLNPIASGCTAVATIRPLADAKFAWVTSTVTLGGVTRSVRQLIGARNVNMWNNAVFAGSGASGQAINGNVDLRGSVHILGEGEAYTDLNGNGARDAAEPFTDVNGNGSWDIGEPFTDSNNDGFYTPAEPYNDTNSNGIYDPPLTQTDLNSSFSGDAHIGNHYSGMPAALEAMIPASPKINGIEQLGAEVRVKHGMIKIQGSATIGSSSAVDGGTSKASIDGSFVNDGFTGNPGGAAVHSENGNTNTYDLGNLPLKFPLLSGIGSEQYTASDGSTWADQETYLNTKALLCPVNTITSTTPAFAYFDANGNVISFTPESGATPAKLTVTGIVRFNGNVQIGSKDTIRFAGSGTIYGNSDVNIDGNLLPAAGLVFPTTTRLGVIAKKDLNLATGAGSAQLSLAGAFFAQGTIRSAKQNEIAGTFVANYYDMGTNVPNIYQVPTLVDNMPPAMPGDKNFFALRLRGWRDRSPKPGESVSY